MRPVSGRRELSALIKLPFELYRGQANWVPPLISERVVHVLEVVDRRERRAD